MSQNSRVWIPLVLGVTIVFAVIAFQSRQGPKSDEVKIGVILPLTGPVAGPGTTAKNGIELAVSQYNSQSPKNKIKLIIEDSQSDPKSGLSAAQKLITVDGVKIIIGDLMSSVAMAIAPVTEQHKVVLFAPGASNPKFLGMGEFLFRNWSSDDYDGTVMADYLFKERRWKRGAIVGVNNEYGIGLANAFEKHFKQLGGEIALSEAYDQGASDFRPIVAKLKSTAGLEFVYLPGQPVENGHLVRQIREGDVQLPLAANLAVESPEFASIVGTAGDRIVFTSPAFDPELQTKGSGTFRKDYQSAYGTEPDVTAGHGYDAAGIVIHALQSANFDVGKLRNALAATKDFPGVTGSTTFLPNREVKKPVFVKTLDQAGNASVVSKYAPE